MGRNPLSFPTQPSNLKWLASFIALIGLMGCMTGPLPTTPTVRPRITPTATPKQAQATPTRTAVASPTPLATPTTTPSPGPTPTPTASIVVYTPTPNDKISRSVHISGVARVSEGHIEFAINDAQGKVLAQGTTYASAGVPQWGVFVVDSIFEPPAKEQAGTVELFTRSPRDGSVQDLVIIPVVLLPK